VTWRDFIINIYSIAELAREFDITARAIRFYEDQGLLSPTREGQGGRNRVYTPRDRTRLKLTLRGKRLGLTLSEIKSIIDMYETPKGFRGPDRPLPGRAGAPARDARAAARRHRDVAGGDRRARGRVPQLAEKQRDAPDNESSLDVYVNVTPRYYSVTLHQRTSNRRSERRQ
jgi:DNA-binding transcriptional MerR regulator